MTSRATRSTRSNGNQDDEVVLLVDGPKRTRTSQRHWNCCPDTKKLPPELCCSGCKLVHDSSSTKPRSAHVSSKHDCFQGWKQDENKVQVGMKRHVQKIKAWILEHNGLDCDEAFDEPETKKTCPCITPRALLHTLQPTTATTDDVIQPTQVTATKEEFKRPLNFYQQTTKCNGRELTYEIPTCYKLMLTSHINKLKNDTEMLQSVKDKLQSSSYTANSMLSQSLWAILMASIPALAFSAAQFAFPMMTHASAFCMTLASLKTILKSTTLQSTTS